jgi:hypothetical protein
LLPGNPCGVLVPAALISVVTTAIGHDGAASQTQLPVAPSFRREYSRGWSIAAPYGMIHVNFPSSSSSSTFATSHDYLPGRPIHDSRAPAEAPSADLYGAAQTLVAASPQEQSSSAALLPDCQVGSQTRESILQGRCLCQRGAGTSPCPVHCSHRPFIHSFTSKFQVRADDISWTLTRASINQVWPCRLGPRGHRKAGLE